MDEELFHRLAEEVEHDYQMGGLSGGLYEDYAHDILARYLAAQHRVQSDVCPVCFGDCERLHNDGLMHKCMVCNGTGKRR